MTSAVGIHVFLWLVPPFNERLMAEHRSRRTRAGSLSVGQEAAWSPCPALGPAVQTCPHSCTNRMEHLLLGEFYSLIHAHDGFGGQAVDKQDTAPARHPPPRAGDAGGSESGGSWCRGRRGQRGQGRRGKRNTRAGTSLIILPTDATPRSWLSSLLNCEKIHVC